MVFSAPSSQSSSVPGLRLLENHTNNAQSISDFEDQLNTMPLTSPPVQPQPSTSSPYATADSPQAQPPPVEPGRAWSSESVSQFNDVCIKAAVQPIFDFAETPAMRDGRPGWNVKLTFTVRMFDGEEMHYEISDPGPFPSKKAAKAAASESARGLLEQALEARNKEMDTAVMKRDYLSGSQKPAQASSAAGQQTQGEQWRPENENWVGFLVEHCRAVGLVAPTFQEFINGSNFSIECSLAARPEQPFGGRDLLFNSKKAAKRYAAQEAVMWLRARGDMPEKGHPSKKRARAPASATTMGAVETAAAGPTISVISSPGNNAAASSSVRVGTPTSPPSSAKPVQTAPPGAAAVASPHPSSSSNPPSPSTSPLPPSDISPGEQLNRLCVSLGLGQPTFNVQPDPRVPSMWSGAAYFRSDPLIARPDEPVGQVHNVYGKINARKEIAKRVVKVLLKMRDERKRVADGVVGGLRAAGSASSSARATPDRSAYPGASASLALDRDVDHSAVRAHVGSSSAEDVVMGEDSK